MLRVQTWAVDTNSRCESSSVERGINDFYVFVGVNDSSLLCFADDILLKAAPQHNRNSSRHLFLYTHTHSHTHTQT